MEQVLQIINREFISLDEDELKENKRILNQLVDEIIQKLRQVDPLFGALYSRLFYGGSTYDNLRIKDTAKNLYEFDLDMLLDLKAFFGKVWESLKPELPLSPDHGYVYFRLNQIERVYSDVPTVKRDLSIKCITKLFTKGYLSNFKVRQWINSIFQLAFNKFNVVRGFYEMELFCGTFYVEKRNSGPAITLNVYKQPFYDCHLMDIDLVPCFVFNQTLWPQGTYRENPAPVKQTFFLVPKPVKNDPQFVLDDEFPNIYWRLSFQEQERFIMNGYNTLKPSIKLLKKLRDNLNHKGIASYYIKSFALWELENKGVSFFWNATLSTAFMTMLKSYQEALSNCTIPYYWDDNFNLLDNIAKPITVINFSNEIQRIIRIIEKNWDKPTIIAEVLLDDEEYQEFVDVYYNTIGGTIREETVDNNSYCVIL